jgi:L-lactate dehydrogenase complex protein LldG
MPSRAEFLQSVRSAIERGRVRAPEPATRAPHRYRQGDAAEAAKAAAARAAEQRAESVATLERMAKLQAWTLHRVSAKAEAVGVVVRIAVGLGAKWVVRSDEAILHGLDAQLAASGVTAAVLSGAEGMKDVAAGADLGVTGVDWVIAETATVVLIARKGRARATSLLPPNYVAVAEAGQVVPTLADALALAHGQAEAEGWRGWYANLVSGPSRTGDIEQTIVIGVHGPGTVHLVLVGA